MNRRILLFWGGSVLLIIMGAGAYLFLSGYIGNNNNQVGINEESDTRYVEAMAADTYGGQTPQETIDLFVAALRANDANLAAKYFMLDENLSRNKWVKILNQLKEQGVLVKMAEDINMSLVNVGFFNRYSHVWKITKI